MKGIHLLALLGPAYLSISKGGEGGGQIVPIQKIAAAIHQYGKAGQNNF